MNIRRLLANAVKTAANLHRPGSAPDIFLFATPRGGSTWTMEIIASQPGFKFYDEPLSPRRENVALSGVVPSWGALMPDTGNSARIIAFLRELQDGKHGYMNPPPFRRNHRYFTNRIVFKIHEIEHLMADVERKCGGQIVYLLRHPIATSISRELLPRLDLFLKCSHHARLLDDPGAHDRISALAAEGTHYQRAVISWCYENLVALRQPGATWLYVTYEELVLNPERSSKLLMQRLQLTDRTAMLQAFDQPATNIQLSHEHTLAALRTADARRRRHRLVTKWMDQVSEEQRRQSAEVLDLFKIDVYRVDSPIADQRFIHFDDTAHILGRERAGGSVC